MSSLAQPGPTLVAADVSEEKALPFIWFRRLAIGFAFFAALGIGAHLALVLWAQSEFTAPESIVGTQSAMFVRDGRLYEDVNAYPYTVRAYMPLFYLAEAFAGNFGFSTMHAGRLLSFASVLGILVLVWRLLTLYTQQQVYVWTGTLTAASTALLLTWGTVGQVDTFAIFWTLFAFYHYSRYFLRDEPALPWAGLCILLAFFTKQTMLACPAAICLHLWISRRKSVAVLFGASLTAAAALLLALCSLWFGPAFLANTVRANMNPFTLSKIWPHLQYIVVATGPLLLILAIGFRAGCQGRYLPLFLYLGTAAAVFAFTSPKIGSDGNYQVESTLLVILCSSVSLQALGFFRLLFSHSRHWITLLQLPLAIYLVENYRITESLLERRIANEAKFKVQLETLEPLVADGRLLSTDYNVMARLRGSMEVEPLIYHLLTRAGVVDPEPLRRDLAAQAFSAILLYEDLNHPSNFDIEVSSFPPPQLDEIRKHYRLAAHVPGPYLKGLFLYKPIQQGAR